MAPLLIAYSVGLVVGAVAGIAGLIFLVNKFDRMSQYNRKEHATDFLHQRAMITLEESKRALEQERENLEAVRLALQEEARRLYGGELTS